MKQHGTESITHVTQRALAPAIAAQTRLLNAACYWLAPDAAAAPLAPIALSVAAGALAPVAVSEVVLSAFLQPAPSDIDTTASASKKCFKAAFVMVSPVYVAGPAPPSRRTCRSDYCPFVSLLASAPGMLVVALAGFMCEVDFL
jgi:hypothetical protein